MSDFGADRSPHLSPDDARIVDLLLGREHEPDSDNPADDHPLSTLESLADGLGPDDRPRAAALRELLGQLDRYPVSEADDALVDATLARVDRVDHDLASLPLQEMRERHRSLRFRVPDLVGLAAAVLLAVGVLMPVTSRMRMASVDAQCSNNLRLVGAACATYANDFNGSLPMRAGLLSWDREPSGANFGVLRDLGYCDQGHLNCPGHFGNDGQGGYGFRALDHSNRARLVMAPPSALMADRSHVVDYARAGERVTNLAVPSANHGHRGQYVLLGSLDVIWTASPLIPGVRGGMDNIYLIRVAPGNEDLAPGQRTVSPDDHFTH